MKDFLAFVDGYKRVIVIVVALVQLWLLQVFHVDVRPYTDGVFAVLGWNPEQLTGIPIAVIVTTVGGGVAIYDGLKKAIAEGRNRAAAG